MVTTAGRTDYTSCSTVGGVLSSAAAGTPAAIVSQSQAAACRVNLLVVTTPDPPGMLLRSNAFPAFPA
jgi:broad specificity polyphosphatase/5'/3'-nucleotidase SurE